MKRVVIAALVFGVNGCGTVCNLADSEPKVYGGVQNDVRVYQQLSENPLHPGFVSGAGYQGALGAAVIAAILAGDPIFSFAGDTLTLPAVLLLQDFHNPDRASGCIPDSAIPEATPEPNREPLPEPLPDADSTDTHSAGTTGPSLPQPLF